MNELSNNLIAHQITQIISQIQQYHPSVTFKPRAINFDVTRALKVFRARVLYIFLFDLHLENFDRLN